MNRTGIETTDFTWNAASGCRGVGCAVWEKCWARRQVKRLGRFCPKCPTFEPHMHMDRLNEPLQVKKPAKIFPVSTGDLFGLEPAQISMILDVIERVSWHTFQPLTKQPQNARSFSPFGSNVWFGVSVNQQGDTWRLDELQKIEAPIRFAYFEPLYSAIDYDLSFLNWIVIGAQTRPNLQPQPEWVQDILDQADENNIPVLTKSNLEWAEKFKEFPA